MGKAKECNKGRQVKYIDRVEGTARAPDGVILGVKRKLPAADARCPGCLVGTVPEGTQDRRAFWVGNNTGKKQRCKLRVFSAS